MMSLEMWLLTAAFYKSYSKKKKRWGLNPNPRHTSERVNLFTSNNGTIKAYSVETKQSGGATAAGPD